MTWRLVDSPKTAGPAAPSASIGVLLNRPVSPTIANLPLENQAGRTLTLRTFEGRIVMIVPFLTSCQEECPITTGALLAMRQSIATDGLANKVVVAEVTVDPGRDSPARMAAFAKLTGSSWPLLTGSGPTLARLWKYFGIYYERVPEGSPPGIDWETHKPYTYDVDHSDGFVLLDASQHQRFIAGGMVQIAGIPARLQGLLDAEGRSNMKDPGGGAWTVPDGLNAIGWLLDRPVPEH